VRNFDEHVSALQLKEIYVTLRARAQHSMRA
jgi:hypothetical protein